MYVEGERMVEYDAVRRKLGVWQKGIRKSIWRDANNLEKARTFRQFLAWYVTYTFILLDGTFLQFDDRDILR